MCVVDIEKAFDRVPRKVLEWALRKIEKPEVLVRSVMTLYEGAKTRVRVDSEMTKEFDINVGMHQGSVLTPLLFALEVEVVTEFAREGALCELLHANDLVLISETIEGLRNKLIKWKEALESKGLKDNLGKSKVMVCGSNTKDVMPKSNVGSCGVCSLRVKANSVFCLQRGKWIHGRCDGMKMVTSKFYTNFTRRKCDENIAEAVDEEVKLCDEVETVNEFTYYGDRVGASGGCEAAVTARTRCGWVKFMGCGELLHGRRFPLKLKGAVYKSYVRPAILYGSMYCMESEIGISQRTKKSMMRAMCGVQVKDKTNLRIWCSCWVWRKS